MAIVGPNGAGKSTLIKNNAQPYKACYWRNFIYNEKYSKVRNKIAYVPQRGSVDWDFQRLYLMWLKWALWKGWMA